MEHQHQRISSPRISARQRPLASGLVSTARMAWPPAAALREYSTPAIARLRDVAEDPLRSFGLQRRATSTIRRNIGTRWNAVLPASRTGQPADVKRGYLEWRLILVLAWAVGGPFGLKRGLTRDASTGLQRKDRVYHLRRTFGSMHSGAWREHPHSVLYNSVAVTAMQPALWKTGARGCRKSVHSHIGDRCTWSCADRDAAHCLSRSAEEPGTAGSSLPPPFTPAMEDPLGS